MAYNMGGRRFRPVGSGKKRTAPQYGPVGTGCPFVEEAVARLYREQNEEHFWSLMNALNYALELQTKVLVPLDAAVDPQSGAAPWAHLPIPEERAEGLQPWLLHTRKERNYLPLFTSVKNAEAEKASATRPMVERSLRRPATLPPPRRAAQRRFLPWGTACIMAGVPGRIRPRPGGCGKRPHRPGRCRP